MNRWVPYVNAFLLVVCLACTPKSEQNDSILSDKRGVKLQYAKGFTITKWGNATLVEVPMPYPNASSGYKYLLVPRGSSPPATDADTKIIEVPIKRIVCTSTSHIPLLDYLDESESLVGFPTTDYISSAQMLKLVGAGKVAELGPDNQINIERLIALAPDLVMAYSSYGDLTQFQQMESLGIPVVMNAEYLETHPLGRAEWIKFMALFFGKEDRADSVFNAIAKKYLALQQLTEAVPHKPTVMSGVVYGDTWFLPGGQNYAARLLADAGTEYLWSENNATGWLELSFEAVFEKAHRADLWIGVASFNRLIDIHQADSRYTGFAAFKNGQVYNYNARSGEKGGNEFLELGYLRPDLILADLIKIAHPEKLPEHNLFFHKQLAE